MENSSLLQHLNFKIAQLAAGEWGGRPAPRLRLNAGAGEDQRGRLQGTIDVTIVTRSGEAVLSTIDLAPLASKSDIDDALADTLSKVLMSHYSWPR
jgi:hypothetical protein